MRPTTLLLSSCILLAACGGDSEDSSDYAFRTQELTVGDFAIHEGESTDNPDCLIFDILGGDVYDGAATREEPRPVLSIEGNALVGPDGETRCTIDAQSDRAFLRVGDADGPIAFTALRHKKWVLDGAFVGPGSSDFSGSDVVYTMLQNHVREGGSFDPIIATGTVELQQVKAETKLLVAALLDGTCF